MYSVELYNNTSDENVVDKSITLISTLNGTLKEECGILNPTLTIEMATVPNFNYVRIPSFGNRYYFVDGNPSVISGNMWKVSFRHDPLMNWKNSFRNLTAVIERQENSYNPYLSDGNAPVEEDSQLYMVKGFNGANSFNSKATVLIYSAAATKD